MATRRAALRLGVLATFRETRRATRRVDLTFRVELTFRALRLVDFRLTGIFILIRKKNKKKLFLLNHSTQVRK